MAVVSGSVPGMSLASLGQAFVATGAVAPATTSPVPMLPLANQRYRASGDERMVVASDRNLKSAPSSARGFEATIGRCVREAYPVAEETPEESVSEETQPEPETEEAQTEQEPVAVEEAQPAAEETPEESVSEEAEPAPEPEEAQTEQEPDAVEEAQPAAEETPEESVSERRNQRPSPKRRRPSRSRMLSRKRSPRRRRRRRESVSEETEPAPEPEEAQTEKEPDAVEEAQPAAEETPEESVSEETEPAPEPEEAQTEQEPDAVEEAQPAAEASEDAQPQLSGLAENGQPLFTTTSNRAYDRFRQKGFEADEKALAAGDDDAKAASAYIFDGDDARTAAFLGGDKRDLLAEAMRDDPERHAYLPPMFQGFDMQASDWKHQPLAPRGGGKNRFKVCLDQGAASWDAAYASGTLFDLFRGGVCFAEITESACEDADVVIFNEGVFLWGGGHRNAQGAIELPPKSDPKQVYMYFAHEAAGTFGWELKDTNVMKQFDYLAYFDRGRRRCGGRSGPPCARCCRTSSSSRGRARTACPAWRGSPRTASRCARPSRRRSRTSSPCSRSGRARTTRRRPSGCPDAATAAARSRT